MSALGHPFQVLLTNPDGRAALRRLLSAIALVDDPKTKSVVLISLRGAAET
jgi:hypothetical protein